MNVISLVQFSRNRAICHIIIDNETVFRGIGKLFRVLFPAFDHFAGYLEQSALALIRRRKHTECFIYLDFPTAEPLHSLGTALFIPDLFTGDCGGIEGIAVFTGYLYNLLEIPLTGTGSIGFFRGYSM